MNTPVPTDQPAPAPRTGHRTAWIIGLAVGLVVLVAGITTAVALGSAAGSTALNKAVDECAQPDTWAGSRDYVQLTDDGHGLRIQTMDAVALQANRTERRYGASLEELTCVLDRLDTPTSVVARMESTNAFDGSQEASWEQFTAVWTYHPDDGMWLVIEES